MGEKRRLELRITKRLYEKISDRASYQGKTINSTCLDIFWEYFENKNVVDKKAEPKQEPSN